MLELRPPVFSFVFGVPSADVLDRCRSAGIATLGAATTAAEAKLLADAGVDMIVASGFEAGGHRVSFLREPEDCLTGTMALIPQVVDTVKVPVIAAGGIADGRGIAAALKLGAAGRADRHGVPRLRGIERARRCIARSCSAPDARRTTLTRAFTGRLARSIHNDFIDALQRQGEACSRRIRCRLAHRAAQARGAGRGRADMISLWSGQGAPLLKHRRGARAAPFTRRRVPATRLA